MALIKSVQGRPDPFATFEKKKSDEYGLQIANIISAEWFGNGTIDSKCNFMSRREYVRGNRLFVRGEQNTQPYKDQISRGDNDLNLLNLDWTNINLVEKFCRIVSNGISDENYVLDIRSSDKLSAKLKEDKKESIRKDMISMPMLKKAKEVLGVDLMPKGFVPESEEELDFLFESEERPIVEIFEEILIDYIKNSNDWDFIRAQNNKDLVDNGLIGARVYTDKNDGVKVAYVDPQDYVHSVVKRNDFADKFYEGVVDTITLSDLIRESDFTELDLRQIAKTYASQNASKVNNYSTCRIDEIIDYKIDVLRFAWKTSKKIVFKKKIRNSKTVKVSLKNDLFVVPDQEDVGMITRTLDTWFEGNYVIGANAIYNYIECENLARDTMNKAMSPFVFMASDMYENRPRAFLTNIKPIAERMQGILLKLQLLTAELKPDLIVIDLDQLANLDDGKGGAKKQVWETAASLMNVKGLIFTKRNDLGELGIKDNASIRPLDQNQGSGITILLNQFAFQYNLIRDITGINPAADGSLSQDALLGVSRMAQLASNTATKHIVDTSIQFNKKICELISTRINGIFKFKDAKHIQELYINVVGKNHAGAIESLKNRHLHEFGFTFRFLPTNEDMREFNEGLSVASSKGYLDEVIVIKSKQFAKTNTKLALKYLSYHTKKEKKRLEDQQMMLAKNKSDNDSAAAQAKVMVDVQGYSEKKKADLAFEAQMSQIRISEAQAMLQINQPVVERKFQQEAQLEQMKSGVKHELENFKETKKDDRTKLQATQQSKMIDQRHKETEPIDFENEYNFEDM